MNDEQDGYEQGPWYSSFALRLVLATGIVSLAFGAALILDAIWQATPFR